MTGKKAYKKLKRKITDGMREAMEAWIQNKCCQLENSVSDNKMKVTYQILKDIICPQQMNMTCNLLSKDGKCLTDKQVVLARWMEYCSEIYSQWLDINPNFLKQLCTTLDEEELPILQDEVVHAV